MDDFLEGDDAFSDDPAPRRRPAPQSRRRRPPRESQPVSAEHRRQIMQRRLAAFGIGVLIIILLVLGVRGCLDARKTRSFENYANDLTALVNEANQLSESFFGRLEDPEGSSDLSFEQQINADRGTAEGLYSRARALSPPSEIAGGHEDIVLAFELRRDGLAAVGAQVSTALGNRGRNRAIRQIAGSMDTFLASDVMYNRGRGQVLAGFETEEIEVTIPESQFLPNNPDYTDPAEVEAALALVSGESTNVSGIHGMGLLSTSVAGVALTPGTEATITTSGAPELVAEVQNQGESRESDVQVKFTLGSGGSAIRGSETISSIDAGETQTVTLPISPAPSSGQPLELDVEVVPVPGEQVTDNNEASFTLIFG